MKQNKSFLFIISICIALTIQFFLTTANANGRLGITGVWHQSKMNVEYTGSHTSYYGEESTPYSATGAGILIEFPLQSYWSFETEFLYFDRGFEYDPNQTGKTTKTHWKNIFIPLLARLWANENFTVALGFYYSQAIGKVTVEAPTYTSQIDFKDAELKTSDFGLIYGIGFNLPLARNTDFFIEFRLTDGLTGVSTDSQTKSIFKDSQILAGFRF